MANKFVRFTNTEALRLLALQQSLRKAGFQDPQINYALAQLLFETGKFTTGSQVAQLNNNYSGINWINKPYQHATKGSPKPSSEGGGYYAHFENMDDWAKDFMRILSLQRSANLVGPPITADTLQKYVDRLSLNGYFASDKTAYFKGLKKYLDMFAS